MARELSYVSLSRWVVLAGMGLFAATSLADDPKEKPPEKKGPPFTITKETTHITEPLFEDGFPNYAAALDRQMKKGISPDDNAFIPLIQIVGPNEIAEKLRPQLAEKLGMPPLAADGKYFVTSGEFQKKLAAEKPADGEAFSDQLDRATNRPWTDQDAPLIARWLEANEKSLADLPKALERKHYYAPILMQHERDSLFMALLPYLQPMRDLNRALLARGLRRVAAGEIEKAEADSLAMHRFARHVARGGFLIDYLVGLAIEAMAVKLDTSIAHHGKLSATQAKAFAAELAKLPELPQTADKFEVERFGYLDAVSLLIREGPEKLDAMTGLAEQKRETPAVKEILRHAVEWDQTLKIGNQTYDQLVAAAKIANWKERWPAVAKVFQEAEEAGSKEGRDPVDWIAAALDSKVRARKAGRFMGHLLTRLLLPAMQQVLKAEERETVKRELVQVALALAAYKADHGNYPETLAPLAPKYLAKLPIDPWSGKDYLYRIEKEGYVLYGVGVNGKDDGGKAATNEDYVLEVK